MFVTPVSKIKVHTRAVLGGGPHEVTHDAGDVKGQLPLWFLGHLLVAWGSCLRPAASVDLFSAILCPLLSLWGHHLPCLLPFRLEFPLPS